MPAVELRFSGVKELADRLDQASKDITQEFIAKIQDGAQAIAAEAKQRAPGNFGFLRNLISAPKTPTGAEVVSAANYSAFVEFGTVHQVRYEGEDASYAAEFIGAGTGSGLSAKDSIFLWAKAKGIDPKLWYVIYRSIMEHGIRAQPFLFPAIRRITPIILDDLRKTLEKI